MSSNEMRKFMTALNKKKTLKEDAPGVWSGDTGDGFDPKNATDVADTMDHFADKMEELAGDLVDTYDQISRHIEDARRNGHDAGLISAMETQKKQALITAMRVAKNLM